MIILAEKNEYKMTVCSLTGEECDLGDCRDCEESETHEHEERIRAHHNLVPDELEEKKGTIFKINYHRTVAELPIGTELGQIFNLFNLIDSIPIPIPYNMSKLIVRWPHFVMVKYITSIGVPNKLIEMSDYLIAYYDDAIYVTAPMFTNAEMDRKR